MPGTRCPRNTRRTAEDLVPHASDCENVVTQASAFKGVAVALLRPRWWLAATVVLVLAAGGLTAARLLSDRPSSPPGTVTMTRALPAGLGTVSLTAQWSRPNRAGLPLTLGGFSARFSTCHSGGFLDLKQYCGALANPFFTVLGVTSPGGIAFELTTRTVENNFAHGHHTAWIVPIDRHSGSLYRLAAREDLIVQLWAIDTRTALPHMLGEIHG